MDGRQGLVAAIGGRLWHRRGADDRRGAAAASSQAWTCPPLHWLVGGFGASRGLDRFLAELGRKLRANGLPLAGRLPQAVDPLLDATATYEPPISTGVFSYATHGALPCLISLAPRTKAPVHHTLGGCPDRNGLGAAAFAPTLRDRCRTRGEPEKASLVCPANGFLLYARFVPPRRKINLLTLLI